MTTTTAYNLHSNSYWFSVIQNNVNLTSSAARDLARQIAAKEWPELVDKMTEPLPTFDEAFKAGKRFRFNYDTKEDGAKMFVISGTKFGYIKLSSKRLSCVGVFFSAENNRCGNREVILLD